MLSAQRADSFPLYLGATAVRQDRCRPNLTDDGPAWPISEPSEPGDPDYLTYVPPVHVLGGGPWRRSSWFVALLQTLVLRPLLALVGPPGAPGLDRPLAATPPATGFRHSARDLRQRTAGGLTRQHFFLTTRIIVISYPMELIRARQISLV